MALAAGEDSISVLPLSITYSAVESTLNFGLGVILGTLGDF
jgi:hypothetical protein